MVIENINLNKHISAQFNSDLEQVRNQVMEMGGLVEQQLADAIAALHGRDRDLADKVLLHEQRVDELESLIDAQCTRIIAKRQPAAIDLRMLVSILKVVSDLERIGDTAVHLVGLVKNDSGRGLMPLVSLENVAKHTIRMLHQVLDAFARMDTELAVAVHKEDREIDRQYESLIRELATYMMEDPRSIPQALNVLFCSRDIARIGDRCKNIAEAIIYFVKGQDVRHIGDKTLDDVIAHDDQP